MLPPEGQDVQVARLTRWFERHPFAVCWVIIVAVAWAAIVLHP